MAKRNARERRRVQAVNQAFYRLRKCVPIENRNKRVSKVKTLQRAIDYIRKLERILAEDDSTAAVQREPESTQSAVVANPHRNSGSFNSSMVEVDTTTATHAGAPEPTANNNSLPMPADSTSASSSNHQYTYGSPFDDEQATAKRQWHTTQVSSAANYCPPPTHIGSPVSTNSSSGSTRPSAYGCAGQQQVTSDHLPTTRADGECCTTPYGPPAADMLASRQMTTGRYGKPQNHPLPSPLLDTQSLHHLQHHLHRPPHQPEPNGQEHIGHNHAYGHWWPQHSPQVQTNQWPQHHNGQLPDATGHLHHNNHHQYLNNHQPFSSDQHQLSPSLQVSCPEPSHLATDLNISAYPNDQLHHRSQPTTNNYQAPTFSSPNQYHLSNSSSNGSSNGSVGSPYSATNNHFRLPVVAINHTGPTTTPSGTSVPTKTPTIETLCDL